MKNVIFLTNHLINKGPVNVMYDICKYLDKSMYTPVIVTLMPERAQGSIAYKFKDLGIEIRCVNANFLKSELLTWWVAKKVQAVIKDLAPCIVHSHCYHPTLVASYLRGVKHITTIHNIAKDDFCMKHGKMMGTYMTHRFRHTLGQIDCAVALSDAMKKYYDGCNENLIRIYNGVDYTNNYSKDELDVIKKKLVIPDDKKIIIVSGSLIPRKNVKYIVSELKKSKREDFLCLFVGQGNLIDACKQLAGHDTRFRFDGFVTNVNEYLAVSDICISASKSEGLPLGVLEALSMGLPMILSSIAPHQEIYDSLKISDIKMCECQEGQLVSLFDSMLDSFFNHIDIAAMTKKIYGADTMAKLYVAEYDKLI